MDHHWNLAHKQARAIKQRKYKKAAVKTLFKHVRNALKG